MMRELSLNVLDIAQNSVRAEASLIKIELIEDTRTNTLEISVSDDGKGMTPEQLASVRDPFFTTRTTRKVGMGIPLFRMAAEMTGGSFDIESTLGKGTKTTARFCTDHLDFTPIGDMCSTVLTLVTMNLHIDFVYTRQIDGRSFTLDTRQLKEILGDVPLNEPSITAWLKDYITENTKQLTEV
ncbi:MAG: sensor histidine kinase [Ruminococcaceae bacterium]|nr:sensor histidine kinase [Oscillospiraceae bacterium]MBQ9913426.1 sensor histidine kinase [Clostridia bacterium]